jgi:ligand-binding sensor domain-containing protein
MYSLPYLFVEPRFGSPVEFAVNRLISVLWGTLAVLVMSLLDPLAGILLALDTMVIKYTSQIYLESFPLFAGLLAIYAFRRHSQAGGGRRGKWFWISAAAMGAAVAGKYLYGVLGVAVLVLFWLEKPRRWKDLGLYLLAALAAFWLLDPALWFDPPGRLWQSVSFHWTYSTSSVDILRANYPWYQALKWITAMVPWHPQIFFVPGPDVVIFALALLGGYWEIRKRPWVVVWGVVTLALLLVWPTKWPQYTLMLIPALCLMAATGLRIAIRTLADFSSYWNIGEGLLPRPGKLFWIPAVIFVVALVSMKVAVEVYHAQQRVGWLQVGAEFSPLPSNQVRAIAAARGGEMYLATAAGVAVWRPDLNAPWGSAARVLQTANSGLVNDDVTALLQDERGGWWFGTAAGVSYWDGAQGWSSYRGADLGLSAAKIQCILQDTGGQVWVGTSAGAAVFDGKTWKPVTTQTARLGSDSVFSMARQAVDGKGYVWFGTLKGVSRLDLQSGEWLNFDLSQYGLGWAGVVDLTFDRSGRLWAATLGDGVSVFNGQGWTTYRSSNSNIPMNAVTRVVETAPGVYWLALSYSTQPGGLLARFDGKDWQVFSAANSGFNDAEGSAMSMDGQGRLWIGTAVNGLIIYQGALLQPTPP